MFINLWIFSKENNYKRYLLYKLSSAYIFINVCYVCVINILVEKVPSKHEITPSYPVLLHQQQLLFNTNSICRYLYDIQYDIAHEDNQINEYYLNIEEYKLQNIITNYQHNPGTVLYISIY